MVVEEIGVGGGEGPVRDDDVCAVAARCMGETEKLGR